MSLRAGCNGARRESSLQTGPGPSGPRAGLGGFWEGFSGQTGLVDFPKDGGRFRQVRMLPGDAAGKARTRFRPVAWSKSDNVAAPSEEEVDLDKLDLTDEKSADIIRAAKIAQLEQLPYEELQKLPRKERLIPKKRSHGKKNPFFRLGDPKKLEMIRETIKRKPRSAEDESEDEGGFLEEDDAEMAEKGIEYSLAALLQKDTLDVDPLTSRRRKKFSVVTGMLSLLSLCSGLPSKRLQSNRPYLNSCV